MTPDSSSRSLAASFDDACPLPEAAAPDVDTSASKPPATTRRRRGKGPDTSILGHIDALAAAACGVAPGAIKLLEGVPGPRGWGAAHIETTPNRMRQLKGVGFNTALAFVQAIAKGWTKILRGDHGRLILVYQVGGRDHCAVVEHKGPVGRGFWSVTTAIPKRVAREPMLYMKP
ncbi:hypothetical protein [Methylobacterium sp. SyP6R]|uniref:hypothetical protein n=1 Tax=Methylobacterium sp. SyP6R TaxID=2718876 RepID=UPI001F33929A|nr:hypothetical protein [Methylobacterium sp. SyP6R]MCF4130274.1 hypothetical protein [Methylobacterium sp. SyP6R]